MNPTFLTLCAAAQVAILHVISGSAGLAPSVILVTIFALFAYTREHWDAHLDMLLLMAGPGGLGMMAAMLAGPSCHVALTWSHYWTMSTGMLALSVPLSWHYARCIVQARREGYGGLALTLDLLGMQAGMALAHLPLSLLGVSQPNLWLQHGVMLIGMLLGMTAGMAGLRFVLRIAGPHQEPRVL
jgi:hypothetical protein